MIELGLKVTLAYLVGAVLGSLLVGFFYGGVDIRKVGSGNAGGTNALRTQGKVFALWVMIIDIGKGILAAAVIPPLVIPGVGIDPTVDRSLVLYARRVRRDLGSRVPRVVRLSRRQGRCDGGGAHLLSGAGRGAARARLVAADRVHDGLRRARDDQRGARRGVVPGCNGVAGAERPVLVRVRARRCCSSTRIAATSAACSTAPSRGSRARLRVGCAAASRHA